MKRYKTTRSEERIFDDYKTGLTRKIVGELQLAPSRIYDQERYYALMGDCGSCPSCACIEQDVQFLAVIEAPATLPLLVVVGGMSFTS